MAPALEGRLHDGGLKRNGREGGGGVFLDPAHEGDTGSALPEVRQHIHGRGTAARGGGGGGGDCRTHRMTGANNAAPEPECVDAVPVRASRTPNLVHVLDPIFKHTVELINK